MYVVFDEFDENEGAWVDDSDEWQWVPTPRGGLPPPLPVAGAWRPGLVAGALEKIYLSRMSDEQEPLMLVKWKGLVRPPSHRSNAHRLPPHPPSLPLSLSHCILSQPIALSPSHPLTL